MSAQQRKPMLKWRRVRGLSGLHARSAGCWLSAWRFAGAYTAGVTGVTLTNEVELGIDYATIEAAQLAAEAATRKLLRRALRELGR
jgi:hypothetical protein